MLTWLCVERSPSGEMLQSQSSSDSSVLEQKILQQQTHPTLTHTHTDMQAALLFLLTAAEVSNGEQLKNTLQYLSGDVFLCLINYIMDVICIRTDKLD